jgi:hypothetical protein
LVPHFSALGSRGMPPVPPTILMSVYIAKVIISYLVKDMAKIEGQQKEKYGIWYMWCLWFCFYAFLFAHGKILKKAVSINYI